MLLIMEYELRYPTSFVSLTNKYTNRNMNRKTIKHEDKLPEFEIKGGPPHSRTTTKKENLTGEDLA